MQFNGKRANYIDERGMPSMIGLFSHVPNNAAASLSFELFDNVLTIFQYLSEYSLYSCFSHTSPASSPDYILSSLLPICTDMAEMALVLTSHRFQISDSHQEKHLSPFLQKDQSVVDYIVDLSCQQSPTVAPRP